MNRENFEKLLQANREAPAELFDMGLFCGTPSACGAPACLLGNLALRTDLQSTFVAKARTIESAGRTVWCNGPQVCKYFGITPVQAERLFAESGCNNARTDRDAAIAYVEHFLATGETPRDDEEHELE